MFGRITILICFVFSILLPVVLPATGLAQVPSRQLVISEVQTGGINELGLEDGRLEFVELYNQTTETVEVNGWKIQYFAASREDVFETNAVPTRDLALLNGSINGLGYVLLSFVDYLADADDYFGQGSTASSGLLARSGGHLRVVDSSNAIIDVIAWGTAKTPETKAMPEIKAGQSASRMEDPEIADYLIDSDNNFADFVVLLEPTPTGGSLVEPNIQEEEEVPAPPCDNLIISEIMPNPTGTDTGQEFIELYNPTDTEVMLEGCLLQTSANTKQFMFSIGSRLLPGEYQAFYSHVTDLVLANAAGGEVMLTGTNTDFSVQYPLEMEANHVWISLNGQWYDSTIPTPGAANVLPQPPVEVVEEETEPEPCPPGKFRNPETNRCKNIQTVSTALAPCAIGQLRNPETNRCRNIVSTVSSLVPCRSGQERNPETNRCRNVAGLSTTQTACQEGYERNPETNRCRKIAANLAASPSVGSVQKSTPPNYTFLIATSVVVLGYGVYEYRKDIQNLLLRLKAYQSAKHSVK